ncbi:zinc finger CCCH domain-containing protein 48 isoform X3 [Hevea brasiliensis]|uniref:zinc finger CCCH domain-containing protein 48 isoform X3 n=1 Tax=Hevea brasiliensis TaxID=3981 RepID=UPI0025FE6BA9|nr:zinc finger CCCH domain-containing protein 48 isoform X3 [Hevea brasiliensis]
MDLDAQGGNSRVFHRLGAQPANDARQQKVCHHWRAGRCSRYPCPYLHRELPPPPPAGSNGNASKRGFSNDSGFSGPSGTRRSGNFSNASSWGRVGNNTILRKTEKVCNYWVQGKCSFGDKCRFLHSWSLGESFSLLTQLDGHQKVVTGIALPSGSDKLYTGSNDETVRVWDCHSGQCMGVIQLGGEVGCMINEDPWIFVGVPNVVKAWNTQTNIDLSLTGPAGQVYALVVGNDLLFAGHTVAVVSLVVGANRLYSGSMDHSIRVWNLETLQCVQTLTEHSSVVMSVLCWDRFLLSCSLDQTIKVWAATESGNLEVTYTHKEEHGLLTLCGMLDFEGKPVLLCSCNDNSVRLLDLPSFSERGKIYAKQEIRAIQTGPGGLFFTGDGTGQVRVWKCVDEPATTA